MAKAFVKHSEGGGGGKFRFVMLEADQWKGDMGEIAQVIANLVRPAHQAQRLISASVRPENGGNGKDASEHEPEELVLEEESPTETPRTAGKARAKTSNPKVLADLDLDAGELSFRAFAEQKGPPKSALARYLLVAYWCKKYRDISAITQDHVYTGYKKMGWGTGSKDFIQPLRDNARFGRGDFSPPNFTINHIGEDFVENKISTK
jgi:hypothetical protein